MQGGKEHGKIDFDVFSRLHSKGGSEVVGLKIRAVKDNTLILYLLCCERPRRDFRDQELIDDFNGYAFRGRIKDDFIVVYNTDVFQRMDAGKLKGLDFKVFVDPGDQFHGLRKTRTSQGGTDLCILRYGKCPFGN